MKITIKNRWTGSIIMESNFETLVEAISEAIGTGTDLTDANFTGANLTSCLFYFGYSYGNFRALCFV